MRGFDFLRLNAAFLSAGFLLTFGSGFGQTFFISIFGGEIRAEFGLSHAAWGQIYSVGTFLSAITMIWAGALTDVFRVRALGALVIGGLSAACLFMAWTPAAWTLIPAIFFLRLLGQGMMSHLGQVSMARWFVATRGRALSIAGMGYGVAEAALPVIFVALLALYDWRWLWVISGIAVLLLMPILQRLLVLERTPQSVASSNHSEGMGNRSWTRNEVLRHRLLWLITPLLLGPSAFNTAFFFHQAHIAEIKGWSHLQLVALFPIYTLVGVLFVFASGFAVDRFGTRRLMPIYQLPMVAAFAIFAVAESPLQMLVGFIFLAISSGANSTIPTAFWAEFYGTRHIGSIKAMATAIMVLGSALGPGITGSLITAGVALEVQMLWIAGYFFVSCVIAYIAISNALRMLPIAP